MPIQPSPDPNTTKPSTIYFEAEHIHTIEEALELELSYRQDMNELGVGSSVPVTGIKQMLPRLDSLKGQFGPPFEFEPADITESYSLAMALCRARFILEYPPDKWEVDLLARFAGDAKSRIREAGFTISDIDAALEPIDQAVSWADDLIEFFFYIEPPSEVPEDELIAEIARQGSKEHVMREIEARRNPNYSFSLYESPERYDVEDAGVEEQAAAFIESWNETRANISNYRLEPELINWEDAWGPVAEEYISRIQQPASS